MSVAVTITGYPHGLGLVLCQLDREAAAQVVLAAAKAGRPATVVYEQEGKA